MGTLSSILAWRIPWIEELGALVSVQLLSHVRLFVTPWTEACQASLSITKSQSLLKLMSIELVMPSNHLLLLSSPFPLAIPFSSCLLSFPASGSFQVSQFFTSRGQSIGDSASESVLTRNIQDWFPLGWTGCLTQAVFKPQSFIWVRYMWHLFCTVSSGLLDSEGN